MPAPRPCSPGSSPAQPPSSTPAAARPAGTRMKVGVSSIRKFDSREQHLPPFLSSIEKANTPCYHAERASQDVCVLQHPRSHGEFACRPSRRPNAIRQMWHGIGLSKLQWMVLRSKDEYANLQGRPKGTKFLYLPRTGCGARLKPPG